MDFIDYKEKLGIGFCDKDKFKYFKTKIFNVLNIASKDYSSECMDSEEYYTFCNITGTPYNTNYDSDYQNRDRFEHCLSIIERTNSLNEFLSYYVALVNSVKTEKYSEYSWKRANFSNLLCNMLDESHIQFDLLEDEGEYFIFPKGAEELDKALVSEPLEWLKDYPNSHKAFVKALKAYSGVTEENASDVADLFRKALETFFQEFFCGSRSLEKYVEDRTYEKYLDTQGIPSDLRGEFENTVKMYTKFINHNAKHHDKTNKNILEYVMYQTGNIIRLLITLEKGAQKDA